MKLKTASEVFFMAMVLMHSHLGLSLAGENSKGHGEQAVTVFSYHAGPGDSRQVARALALYGAKHSAVLLSANLLAGRGLLKDYEEKQMEVFCLVANELQSSIINESFSEKSRIYKVKIKSNITIADFVKAEIENKTFEKQENKFSWQEEMEQAVSPIMAPALELSRAHRYIREHLWRIAIIYLDHLEKKYSHWGALFYAKGMVYLGMHETQKAISTLSSACYLGDQEACLIINELDPSD